MTRTIDHRQVVALLYDGLCGFEFGIATELFALPRPEFSAWYRFAVCSHETGSFVMSGGVSVHAPGRLGRLDRAGTIVIPGWRNIHETPPAPVLRKLRRAQDRGARLVSFCSGAFVLAAAGVLNGRRVTTHWRYADALQDRYPELTVDAKVLYVDEGNILTSAGSAAGVDMGLHLIRRDFGSAVANQVARRLVLPPHRDGGQVQFIDHRIADQGDDGIAELLDWLRQHLKESHTVASMARQARLSPRTLARRFQERVGMSPHAWLVRERVRLAEQALETSSVGMDRLALDCGFGSAQLLRLHFRRIVGTTPTAYRRAFQHGVEGRQAPVGGR